jgi:hypothetical protein
LRYLHTARRHDYLAAFFGLWKSRLSGRRIQRLEQQTANTESELFSFTHTRRIVSATPASTFKLLDRAREGISQMNSTVMPSFANRMPRVTDLPLGTSFSSLNTSEEGLDRMVRRYRSDRWRLLRPPVVFVRWGGGFHAELMDATGQRERAENFDERREINGGSLRVDERQPVLRMGGTSTFGATSYPANRIESMRRSKRKRIDSHGSQRGSECDNEGDRPRISR